MANSNSKAAENALRKLLINMRNETRENHTQALANFKAAVRAYNKAQVNTVKAVNEALENPTVQNVNRAAGALGNALIMAEKVTRARSVLAQAAGPPVNTVPIGKNNFKVTRNNTGKIVKLAGRGGEYHQFGSQNEKNYVQLENGAWYQLRNTSGQKYNKNKSSGKFVKKQGFLGRVGGAVAGGARATGGALSGLFRRRPVPVKPNSETARLLEPTK